MTSGSDPFGFDGRVCLVAGASGSIGSSLARSLLEAGAIVHMQGRSRASVLDDLASVAPTRSRVWMGDLTESDACERLVRSVVARDGRVNCAFVCVGSALDGPLESCREGDMRSTLRSNLLPVVRLVDSLLASMIPERSGEIVVVSSITGRVGQPMRTLYGAAKGAVDAYVRSAARLAAPHGIRVNGLRPQVLEGGMSTAMKERIRALMVDLTPLGRVGTEEEVAYPAMFLASRFSGFVAGEGMNTTGGLVTW